MCLIPLFEESRSEVRAPDRIPGHREMGGFRYTGPDGQSHVSNGPANKFGVGFYRVFSRKPEPSDWSLNEWGTARQQNLDQPHRQTNCDEK
jgi:hypothetical protein